MKALLEIEVDGLYCGINCHALHMSKLFAGAGHCLAHIGIDGAYVELEGRSPNFERHPKCLAATARAHGLLEAEAELKRMKAAETYENERMP